jgi:flagellar motor component MotA
VRGASGEAHVDDGESGQSERKRREIRRIEISFFFLPAVGIVGQLTGIVLALAAYHGE